MVAGLSVFRWVSETFLWNPSENGVPPIFTKWHLQTEIEKTVFFKLKSSIQKPCIKSPLSNSLPQEGVTACRRVKIDIGRLKTLRAGDKLALLPGHEVSVF